MLVNRRQFAASCVASVAFGGLASAAVQNDLGYRNEVAGFGPLRRDPAGILDLPEGFSYRVISSAGEAMDDGFITPDKFDGMAAIPLSRGRTALVRNQELKPEDAHLGPAGGLRRLEERLLGERHYGKDRAGRVLPGGTTTLILDAAGNRLSHFLSLAGTAVNCAGGPTPWNSWLSCEETNLDAPDVERSHGWVFEVRADRRGLGSAEPIRAMGRFRHEAAAVDPASGVVYLTEDRENGLFYRFVPEVRGRMRSGGRLQALAIVDGPADTRNWSGTAFAPRASYRVRWVDLEDTHAPADDLRLRGAAAGAALFARGEGLHGDRGDYYFTCSSGGAARFGQVFRFRPATAGRAETIDLFLESGDRQLFEYGDNLTVAPNGHLVVCEDRSGDATNYLRGVTPEGQLYTLARLIVNTELAGATFSAGGDVMFLNIYRPGRTLAIRGPWQTRFA